MTDRDDRIETWWRDLCAALDVEDPGTDAAQVLDLAAVAAHGVVRPAAPMTTFLVGYAAGLAGGGAAAVEAASRRATELAGSGGTGSDGTGSGGRGADGGPES